MNIKLDFRHSFPFALLELLDFSCAVIAQQEKGQTRATGLQEIGDFGETGQKMMCQVCRGPGRAALEGTSSGAGGRLVIL